MFIFVVQILQKKWNKIRMKQLDSGKHMENDYFSRTLKFEMRMIDFVKFTIGSCFLGLKLAVTVGNIKNLVMDCCVKMLGSSPIASSSMSRSASSTLTKNCCKRVLSEVSLYVCHNQQM
jgi:hypothetical protein